MVFMSVHLYGMDICNAKGKIDLGVHVQVSTHYIDSLRKNAGFSANVNGYFIFRYPWWKRWAGHLISPDAGRHVPVRGAAVS